MLLQIPVEVMCPIFFKQSVKVYVCNLWCENNFYLHFTKKELLSASYDSVLREPEWTICHFTENELLSVFYDSLSGEPEWAICHFTENELLSAYNCPHTVQFIGS